MKKQLGLSLKKERGAILVISAVSMLAFISFFSLVVDLGHIFVTKAELQNTADSAAMAAILDILAEDVQTADNTARQFGQSHQVAGDQILIDQDDIVFGHYDFDLSEFQPNVLPTNAVEVTARRSQGSLSGPLALFFAPIFGTEISNVAATARAVLDTRVTGLTITNQLLPFSVHEDLVDTDGDGQWDIGNIVDIYPHDNTPGNFGLLDLDDGSNGTFDLNEWIAEGYEGTFIIPPGGSLEIPGNPGIHGASIEEALQTVIDEGMIRFLPVHNSVVSQGSNTIYNIIAVVAVQLLDFQLTGNQNQRRINIEIITSASSAFAVANDAQESETLVKPRLAL